jgi:uncharacterized membrane protein
MSRSSGSAIRLGHRQVIALGEQVRDFQKPCAWARWRVGGCSFVAVHAMEQIARVFEWLGIAAIVVGSLVTAWVSVAVYRTGGPAAAYVAGRRTFGRALLASLEVFVAADLIRTVSVDLTLEGIGSLGLLVVIRTILSFSIDVEITGVAPWRARDVEGAQE